MKKLLLIGLIFLSACNNRIVQLNGFDSYVIEFVSQANKYGKTLDITNLLIEQSPLPNNTNGETLGQCNMDLNNPVVTINSDYWPSLDAYSRKALLFHELGHCLLGREHNNNLDFTGKPVSLMNMYLVGSWYFNNSSYDSYMLELMTGY